MTVKCYTAVPKLYNPLLVLEEGGKQERQHLGSAIPPVIPVNAKNERTMA
jgi:hypothetical protein